MASTYVNALRLNEMGTGDESGNWGVVTNLNLDLIGEAFGYGSEAIADASTHTITMADGAVDEVRNFYLKCTGGGQACTVTLAPNTVSKIWIIENATSYTLTFSQGSGANVAVPASDVKVIATDGAGGGAVVYDLFVDLNIATKLTIKNPATSASPATLLLQSGDTAVVDTDVLGKIQFQAPDEAGGTDSILVAAEIAAIATDTFAADNNATKLSFKTGASEAATEKMSLSSAGKLTVTGGSALGDAAADAHTLTGTYAVNSNNVAVGNRMIFTSSGTFTKADEVPAHVVNVTVHCIGGGGGGGGGDTDTAKRGTGGGGGGYTMERLALSALSSDETVTVGAAGATGATQSSPTAGGAGGTSSFGSHCSATGGGAGSAATGGAMGGSSGGAGSGGDLNATGGSSYVQHDGSHVSFGGNAAGPWGGGAAASNVATAGNAYGGGASNLNHVTSTAAGAAGLVVVEW